MQERRAFTSIETDRHAAILTRFLRSPRIVLAVVVVLVVAIDQITKSFAQADLAHRTVRIVGPLSLKLLYNTGVAFSIGSGNAPLVTVVELVVISGILLYAIRIKTTLLTVGFAMVIGGALGNISDRLFRNNHGAVIDFIHTGFWPTFNLADTSVVIGIVVILIASRPKSTRSA